jgi:hypothetical protein
MKLKDKKRAPVSGWKYRYTIQRFSLSFPATVYGDSWTRLIANIKKDMQSNAHPIPNDLEYQVEQQICASQPEDRCWQQSGDVTANLIHGAAKMIDSIAGTKLARKAKGCLSCAKRREKMNKIL